MKHTFPLIVSMSLFTLSACGDGFDRAVSSNVDSGQFGNATMNNIQLQTGQKDFTVALGERFAAEVPSTITFAFNSSELTPEAQVTLRHQADWNRQFPEIRFRVYGHTDLVGSNLTTVAAWSYPPSAGRTRWHVARRATPLRRAVCGIVIGRGARITECRTAATARRASGPICLRCARWLALRGARPAGMLIPFPPDRSGA